MAEEHSTNVFDGVARNADNATKALNNLSGALVNLGKVSNALGNLDSLSKGVTSIANALGAFRELPLIGKTLENIDFGSFHTQLKNLATAFEPLRGFRTQAGSVIIALTSLGEAVDQVNNTPLDTLKGNIKELKKALGQLNSVKPTIGSTMQALKQLPDIVSDLDALNVVGARGFTGFETFTANIGQLSNAFNQLNSVKSSIGSTLGQLDRFYDTTAKLNKVDIAGFKKLVSGIKRAINPLGSIPKTNLGTIAGQLNNFIKTLMGVANVSKEDISKLNDFGIGVMDALQPLTNIKNIGVGNIGSQINRLLDAFTNLAAFDLDSITPARDALLQILGIFNQISFPDKTSFEGLTNLIRNLVKLPKALMAFNDLPQEQLDAFIVRINNFANALAPLQQQLFPIITLLGRLSPKLDLSTNALERATKGASKFSKGMNILKKIIGGGGIVYLVRRLSKIFGNAFKESTDYVESLNLFAVATGSFHEDAQKVIDGWSEILGIDPKQAMEKWGEFNLLIKGFGDTSQEWIDASSNMSKNLTQLGYDLASLYNVDIDVAFTKLQSGMSGMSRPLREWGIDISETALKQFAFEKGITKSVESMTQAEKVQLRYALIMQKTASAQGDLAKTLQSPGNQLRILRQLFTQLKRAMGDFIAPIVQSFIPAVGAFTKLLIEMFNTLAETLRTITGFKKPEVSDFIKEVGDSASSSEEEIYDLTDAMYGLVSGIDKFNVLSKGESKNYGLTEIFEGLADYDYSLLDGIKEQISTTMDELRPVFNIITKAIKGLIQVVSKLKINFRALVKTVSLLLGVKLSIWLYGLLKAFIATKAAVLSFSSACAALTKVGLFLLIYQIFMLIDGWKEFTTWQKVVRIAVIALTTAFTVLTYSIMGMGAAIKKKILGTFAVLVLKQMGSLGLAVGNLTLSFAGLFASIYVVIKLIDNWGNMNSVEKIIGVLGALSIAALSCALAIGAFHSAWSLGLAAAGIVAGIVMVTSAINNAQKRIDSMKNTQGETLSVPVNFKASGGFNPVGNLMITNERGIPEWVGRAGNQSAVVNDTQMNKIMYQAVKEGVQDAILNSNNKTNITFDFKGTDNNALARAISPALVMELRRQGFKVQKA